MTKEEFAALYLQHLNPQQLEAVYAVNGPVLLLAVPGSGKTTVLVHRLGYMVHVCNILPDRILTMSYTTAAANEMRERFAALYGRDYADHIQFRTINSVALEIIKTYTGMNHSTAFRMPNDNGTLLKILQSIYQKFEEEYPDDNTLKEIQRQIAYIKNMQLTNEEIVALDQDMPSLSKIYAKYRNTLKKQQLMDFDDQLVYALRILKTKSEVLQLYQNRYQYICVDESQDTSKIQHEIIQTLAEKYRNIFMVGDEDQSIYGFRAAYPKALLDFQERYKDGVLLRLENNYRSTEKIVDLANRFIERNTERLPKRMHATQEAGNRVQIIKTADRDAQFRYLLETARCCSEETTVLYRNNDSAIPLIDLLERNQIPYNCRKADNSFFTHRIIRDITDIIHFAKCPTDGEIFMRIYNKIFEWIRKEWAEAACKKSKLTGEPILRELGKNKEINWRTRERISDSIIVLESLQKMNTVKALQSIWDQLNYYSYVKRMKLEENKFTTLSMLAKQTTEISELLNRLSELEQIISTHKNGAEVLFTLSTIHSSKGMEFARVFMLDIIDGILPDKPRDALATSDDRAKYEEDRRLFYVGITRAKRELYLFNCNGSDSTFISEAGGYVNKPGTEQKSLFYSMFQKIFDKHYYDREYGCGNVIAYCRQNILVEFSKKRCMLMTVHELYDREQIE